MERSVAASQGFELAGLVLERNTSHSANWGCSCREWRGGRPLFFFHLLILVCVCVLVLCGTTVCMCSHVFKREWLRRVLWSTPLSPPPLWRLTKKALLRLVRSISSLGCGVAMANLCRNATTGAATSLSRRIDFNRLLWETCGPVGFHLYVQATQEHKRTRSLIAGSEWAFGAGGQVWLSGRFHAFMHCCFSSIMRCDASD